MDMSNFRPELHVAQQSRRDKLRIQQCSTSVQQLEDYTHNLGQSSANPDLIQVRNVRNANLLYDPSLGSTEVISFSTNPDVLSAHRNAMLHQELGAAQPNNRPLMGGEDLFTNLPHPVSSHFNVSSRTTGDFQGCGNWKSLDSQPSSGWVVNYANESAGRESNQNSMLVGEVLSNNVKAGNMSSSRKYLKPNNYNEYQYVQSSLTNASSEISCQDRQKHYGYMNLATSLYQSNVHDVVTLASMGTQGLEVASLVQQNTRESGHGTWTDSGNELVLLPNFANHSSELRYDSANTWMNRPEESCHPCSTESGFVARKSGLELRNAASDATTQGLSLSLSSNPPPKIHVAQLADGYESQDPHSRTDVFKEPHDSQAPKSSHLGSIPKPSVISKSSGRSLQEFVGSSNYNIHRTGGPLGPFTGYATILKSSRFLKPAQDLLDEFCTISSRTKFARTSDASERISGDHISASFSASADADAVDAADKEVGVKGNNNSAVSSSTFYGSNQISCDGGVGSSSSESYRPEYQQKKAKLLYLQEEVFRRYKLYHQQMQMVVSSFESVAGLSAATPYVSLALKTISKNFRCLKNTISNQLKHVTKALGEDLLSSPSGTSTSKGGDTNTSRLKYADQSFQRLKSGGANVGFLEPQQHVWRPQRGLPERSVAILRAWLFEHFLHPYPTDTDKHMLATQTGLSRNQVSNWFINARVRVWKPMVEEIHMLETKGMAETNQNSSRSDGKSTASEGTGRSSGDQPMNKLGISAMSDEQLDYSGIGSSVGTEDGLVTAEQWNQEKRSRVDCQVTTNMDRSFMSFMPYQRGGLEVGGLGAVSLTLGLRHGVESSQQQQQTDQLRQQLGGQMIHDFVG